MNVFFDKVRRLWIQLHYVFIIDGHKKAEWLRKHHVFHYIGDNVFIKTTRLPAEPFLVAIHNNVRLAADVRLVTHSLTNVVFNNYTGTDQFYCQHGKIEIHDNVFVGAGATIMYGVTIGKNCIIAAESVVTKDVPPGSVVAGVPARIISTFEESMEKARAFSDKYKGKNLKGRTVADLVEACPIIFDVDRA